MNLNLSVVTKNRVLVFHIIVFILIFSFNFFWVCLYIFFDLVFFCLFL